MHRRYEISRGSLSVSHKTRRSESVITSVFSRFGTLELCSAWHLAQEKLCSLLLTLSSTQIGRLYIEGGLVSIQRLDEFTVGFQEITSFREVHFESPAVAASLEHAISRPQPRLIGCWRNAKVLRYCYCYCTVVSGRS